MKQKSNLARLLKAAQKAQKHSHAPYSGCSVGASLLTHKGQIFSGCNVENASYGGTVCAERTAVFKAVSDAGPLKIAEICVLSPPVAKKPWPPCGLCRQVIQEFATPTTMVHLATPKGVQKSILFSDLFPSGFSGDSLPKTSQKK